MAIVSLECSNCGKEIRGDDAQDSCFCMYCGATVELPHVAQGDAPAKPLTREQAEAAYAFSLLTPGGDARPKDDDIRTAESKFAGLIQSNSQNHLAWTGLFMVMLRNVQNTFAATPKIEGTLYWLDPETTPLSERYNVNSYFCRVMVGTKGVIRQAVLDDILQPGRKAKLYLSNALRLSPEAQREALEDIRYTYFEKPFEEMPQAGAQELVRLQEEQLNRP